MLAETPGPLLPTTASGDLNYHVIESEVGLLGLSCAYESLSILLQGRSLFCKSRAGLIVCIAHELPDSADSAGPGTHLEK